MEGEKCMNDLFGPDKCPCCGQVIEDGSIQSTGSFAAFWESWSNKRGKADAQRAWKALHPADRALAADRAAEWCRVWRAENPSASHIHAATYLRQRRFLDLDEIKAEIKVNRAGVDERLAAAIRAGKRHLVGHMSAARAREMIAGGLVTEAECRAVGVL